MSNLLVDRYELQEPLASGGMGTVYRATDERLQRTVAVKVLKENLSGDPRFVERFRREARAAAGLTHPNIASVFDYGEEERRHFIVMEFVDGWDLAHVLREEGRLEPRRAAEIAGQVALALGHAHASGLVHRDVKTSNVMLTGNDQVKVTDFGIARAAGDATLTATGAIMGTAHYLSPEQASGKPARPASDVYSLGIVLYEMLTGALPFSGDSALGVAMRHIQDPVPRPSALNPSVPPHLDEVVATATAKYPEARYSDGDAFAAALGGGSTEAATAALGAPVETAVLGPDARAPARDWNPRRIGRAVAGVLLGLLLVALVLALVRAADDDPEEEPRRAALSETNEPETDEAPVEESPTPTESGISSIPTDIIGEPYKEWEERLTEAGFEVDAEDVDTDEFEKDAIVNTDPEPGSGLEPGQTVTLFVSTGKSEDHDNGSGGNGRGRDDAPGLEGKGKDD